MESLVKAFILRIGRCKDLFFTLCEKPIRYTFLMTVIGEIYPQSE